MMIATSLHMVEYVVIGVYLVLMLVVGALVKSFSRDISDFFRGGCRGTWWLVGMSVFMSSFSAWTFTGAAGVAYQAGWTALIVFWANAAGFLLNFLCFAPWFRQLRAITAPEIIRERFGPVTQQFYGYVAILIGLLHSGLHLYGLAVFSSTVFGIPLDWVIFGIGFVVLAYSTSGGSWAVMATDFIQSLILLPVTIVVAWLALREFGGIGGFTSAIDRAGLSDEFRIINSPGQFAAGAFTWGWMTGMVVKNVVAFNTINSAPRYFAVKNGRDARKAAMLGLVLTLIGSAFWFIPPMAARLLYADQVTATGLKNSQETAFAVASLNLLPTGMIGLVVVAMFTATMSAMDTGLNRNAGILVRDVIPALLRVLGLRPLDAGNSSMLALSRALTIALGVAILGLAYWFSRMEGVGIFDIMLNIGSYLAIPMAIPMFLGLLIKRVPSWAGMAAVIAGFCMSVVIVGGNHFFGLRLNFQETLAMTGGSGATVFLFSRFFWKFETGAYRSRVKDFFVKMKTPVNFETEVGAATDLRQLALLGNILLVVSLLVLPLSFINEEAHQQWSVVFIFGSLFGIGLLMKFAGRRFGNRP
jgi:solute:Na+ symporter, SSS family